MTDQRYGPIAAMVCPNCQISDTADVFYVRDPKDNLFVCAVTRCVVCAWLTLLEMA